MTKTNTTPNSWAKKTHCQMVSSNKTTHEFIQCKQGTQGTCNLATEPTDPQTASTDL
jgi:hypothetical protein